MTAHDFGETTTRVVVLGAGYAGVMATNRLLGSLTERERASLEVTVVNPRAEFVERIRLHEVAAGSRDSVSTPLGLVLHAQAQVVVGYATMIDAQARSARVITPDHELDLPYDHLIYAVGSHAATPFPGARRHAFLLADPEDAMAAAAALAHASNMRRRELAIVGGGFTGIEAASELAEQHPGDQVTVFCSDVLAPSMRQAARTSIARTLRRLGVRIVENARVAEIESGLLRLEGGEKQRFDVCLVAASFAVPTLAADSGLPVDDSGRLKVDETLRCVSDSAIVGAGDAIVAPACVAAHLRMGCAAALPLGGHAAQTVLASLRGTSAAPFSMGYLIQCLSLGRRKGYIQVVHPDDSPRRVHIGGRLGAAIKEKICAMVIDAPVKESRRPGAYSWPKGP